MTGPKMPNVSTPISTRAATAIVAISGSTRMSVSVGSGTPAVMMRAHASRIGRRHTGSRTPSAPSTTGSSPHRVASSRMGTPSTRLARAISHTASRSAERGSTTTSPGPTSRHSSEPSISGRRARHGTRGDHPCVGKPHAVRAQRQQRLQAGVVGRGHEDQVRAPEQRQIGGDQPLEVRLAEVARVEACRQQHAVDRRGTRLAQDAIGRRGGHALVGQDDDRGDRIGDVRGVRLRRGAPGIDRGGHCLEEIVPFLHRTPRTLAHVEPVRDGDAGGVHDERQVAAVQRQIRRRQRARVAARRIERGPLLTGPGLHPGVRRALPRHVLEAEAADEPRRNPLGAQQRRQRPGPPETGASSRAEHAERVLRARRVRDGQERGDVLLERRDHVVDVRRGADDHPARDARPRAPHSAPSPSRPRDPAASGGTTSARSGACGAGAAVSTTRTATS